MAESLLVANPTVLLVLAGQAAPMVSTIRIFGPATIHFQLEPAVLQLDRNQFSSQYPSHFASKIMDRKKCTFIQFETKNNTYCVNCTYGSNNMGSFTDYFLCIDAIGSCFGHLSQCTQCFTIKTSQLMVRIIRNH